MELFEHNTWGQGNSITGDESPHIPLIIHTPSSKEGAIHLDKVRSIDIMPTLLDLCDISIPNTVDGVSLKPVMDGEVLYKNLPVYYETGMWLSPPSKQKINHITYPNIFHLLEISDQKSGTLSLRSEYIETIESARDWFIWQGRWKLKCYALQGGPYYELFNTEDDFFSTLNKADENDQVIDKLIACRDSIRLCYRDQYGKLS